MERRFVPIYTKRPGSKVGDPDPYTNWENGDGVGEEYVLIYENGNF